MLPWQTKRTRVLSFIGSVSFRNFLRHASVALCMFSAAACSRTGPHDGIAKASAMCDSITRVDSLPSVLKEASGIAESRQQPGLLWVHNDGENPLVIFALDTLAHIRAHLRIGGATK